jgi:hypothetical protein
VLAGLNVPLPLLSFEAAPDFMDNTEACLARLGALGDYEFNYAVGDDFRWLAAKWVKSSEVAGLVKAGAGDVYARLRGRG